MATEDYIFNVPVGISFLFITISAWCLYKFIAAQCNVRHHESIPKSKCLFCAGLFFIIISSICFLSLFMYYVATILADEGSHYMDWALQFFPYAVVLSTWLQFYLTWIVIWSRTRYLLEPSNGSCGCCMYFCITKWFILLILLLAFIMVITMLTFVRSGVNRAMLVYWGVHLSFNVISLVFTSLLARKLSDDEKLNILRRNLLIKTIILAFASFFFSFISVAFYFFYLLVDMDVPYYGYGLADSFFILDVFFSFCCISLTFSAFNSQYRCFCGCIESKCKRWIFKVDETKMINENSTTYALITNNNRTGTVMTVLEMSDPSTRSYGYLST